MTPRSHDAFGLEPAGHVCWLHRGPTVIADVLRSYFLAGLEQGQRLALVGDRSRRGLRRQLEALPDAHDLERDGTLLVLPTRDIFGDLDAEPTSPVSWLLQTLDEALDAGFTGVRIFSDATTALAERPGWVWSSELSIDEVIRDRPIDLLCALDVRRGAHDARVSAALHPTARSDDGHPSFAVTRHGGEVRISGVLDDEQADTLATVVDVLLEHGSAGAAVDLRNATTAGGRVDDELGRLGGPIRR